MGENKMGEYREQSLAAKLRDLAAHMADVAHEMEWQADGKEPYLLHSRELYDAAKQVNGWERELQKEEERHE